MSEKRKPRRNYSVIFRLVLIIIAMSIVFFMSFFITIAVKTHHPIDYIKGEYFDDTPTDKIIDDYARENISNKHDDKESDQKISKDKIEEVDNKKRLDDSTEKNSEVEKPKRKFDGSTISGKLDRISNIKDAVAEQMSAKKNYVKLDKIPRSFRQAIIAVEDSRFYRHSGFDVGSIARATVVNVEAGQIEEGASTITQQLVKNLFLSQEQSFTRKIEELMLAMNMEKNFSKDEILEMYLKSNFYGIYEAAEGYFGKLPSDLTLAESAMLAGLPNAPSLYSPYVNYMLAKKRQLIVIDAMVKSKILTERDAEKAKIETLYFVRDT